MSSSVHVVQIMFNTSSFLQAFSRIMYSLLCNLFDTQIGLLSIFRTLYQCNFHLQITCHTKDGLKTKDELLLIAKENGKL
jgi:hypothetical protein